MIFALLLEFLLLVVWSGLIASLELFLLICGDLLGLGVKISAFPEFDLFVGVLKSPELFRLIVGEWLISFAELLLLTGGDCLVVMLLLWFIVLSLLLRLLLYKGILFPELLLLRGKDMSESRLFDCKVSFSLSSLGGGFFIQFASPSLFVLPTTFI